MPSLSDIRAIVRDGPRSEVRDLAMVFVAEGHDSGRVLEFMARFRPEIELRVCSDDDLEIDLASAGFVNQGGEWICANTRRTSYFQCDHCDDICRIEDRNAYRRGDYCCDPCTNSGDLEYSRITSSYWPEGDAPEPEDDDDDDVSSDDDDDYNSQRVIQNYSTNVLSALKGKAFQFTPEEHLPLLPLWLGVELEVEPKSEDYSVHNKVAVAAHKAVKDFAILKHDGSLGSGGFEIVTVPQTRAAHQVSWTPFFEKAAKDLVSWSSPRCGMHVHISRAALSDLTLGNMLVLVNAESNRSFISEVAGRGSVNYSQLRPKKHGAVRVAERQHTDALAFSGRNHGKTVELRIFRGNVSPGGFFKNLDFTVALCSFCKQASARDLTGAAFYKWLDHPSNRRSFPFLARWASKKGLIATKDKEVPAQYRQPNQYQFEAA